MIFIEIKNTYPLLLIVLQIWHFRGNGKVGLQISGSVSKWLIERSGEKTGWRSRVMVSHVVLMEAAESLNSWKSFKVEDLHPENIQGILELYPKLKPLLRHKDVKCLLLSWTQSNQIGIDMVYQIRLIKKRQILIGPRERKVKYFNSTHKIATSFYLFLYEILIGQLACSSPHARC